MARLGHRPAAGLPRAAVGGSGGAAPAAARQQRKRDRRPPSPFAPPVADCDAAVRPVIGMPKRQQWLTNQVLEVSKVSRNFP